MKKTLLRILLFMILLGLLFVFTACDPASGEGEGEGEGETRLPSDDTSSEGEASSDGSSTSKKTPTKINTLAGKTKEELYLGVSEYLSSLRNFTVLGSEKVTKTYPDGEESVEEMAISMKYAVNTFDVGILQTADGEEGSEMRVVYDGISVYVDMGEDMRYKMKMSYEEFLETFGEDLFGSDAERIPFTVYSQAGIYKHGDEYYLELVGDPAKLTDEQLENLVPEDAVLASFTYRIYLDASGRFLSEKSTVEYTMIEDRQTVLYTEHFDAVLSDVGMTQVEPPEDADEYLDLDEITDPDD